MIGQVHRRAGRAATGEIRGRGASHLIVARKLADRQTRIADRTEPKDRIVALIDHVDVPVRQV